MRSVTGMTLHMIPHREASREPLPAHGAPECCRGNRLLGTLERHCEVRYLGMEEALVFLQLCIRRKAELGNRASGYFALEWSVVLVDMFIAGFCVVEALVKEEAAQFRTLESLHAVQTCDTGELLLRELFNDFPVSFHSFAKGFQADVVSCYDTLLLLFAYVIPNVAEILVEVSLLVGLAVELSNLCKLFREDLLFVEITEVF